MICFSDFKGFIRFACSEKCVLEYHMACWKKYKCQFTNKSTEKVGQSEAHSELSQRSKVGLHFRCLTWF